MPTTRKRRKISSAAALPEEDGAGQRGPGSGRSHRSQAAVWEAPAVLLAEGAVAPLSAVRPRLRPPVDSELALLGVQPARRSAPALLRLPGPPPSDRALLGQLPLRGLRPRSPAGAQRKRRRKRGNPARAKPVARDPEVKRRPRKPALGRAGPGRRPAGNHPPEPPSPADAVKAARKPGRVARGGRFF